MALVRQTSLRKHSAPPPLERVFDAPCGQIEGLMVWEVDDDQTIRKLDIISGEFKVRSSAQGAVKGKGRFQVNCCYIVLISVRPGFDLLHTIYFWIGSETSDDTIMYLLEKTTELHAQLGGTACQYREVEGFESKAFTSLFKKDGLEYLPPVSTALPKLFHVRVTGVKRVKQVPCAASYLTSHDVYVLDTSSAVFVIADVEVSSVDFEAGMILAGNINRYQHDSQTVIRQVDSDSDSLGKLNEIAAVANLNYDSSKFSGVSFSIQLQLFLVRRVSDEEVDFEEVPRPSATLDSSSVFVLIGGLTPDFRQRYLFVWVGRRTESVLKDAALGICIAFMNERNMSSTATQMQCVQEDHTSEAFNEEFAKLLDIKGVSRGPPSLQEPAVVAPVKAVEPIAIPSPTAVERVSPASSPQRVKPAGKQEFRLLTAEDLQSSIVPEGGSVRIWHSSQEDNSSLKLRLYGHFYSSNCYILLYTYPLTSSTPGYVVFSWLGRLSSAADRELTVIGAQTLHRSFANKSLLSSTEEGEETLFFRRLFRGSLIFHPSIHPEPAPILPPTAPVPSTPKSALKTVFKSLKIKLNATRQNIPLLSPKPKKTSSLRGFYKVICDDLLTCYAVHEPLTEDILDTIGTCMLNTENVIFVRFASTPNGIERDAAAILATKLSLLQKNSSGKPKDINSFAKGSEPPAFLNYFVLEREDISISPSVRLADEDDPSVALRL